MPYLVGIQADCLPLLRGTPLEEVVMFDLDCLVGAAAPQLAWQQIAEVPAVMFLRRINPCISRHAVWASDLNPSAAAICRAHARRSWAAQPTTTGSCRLHGSWRTCSRCGQLCALLGMDARGAELLLV